MLVAMPTFLQMVLSFLTDTLDVHPLIANSHPTPPPAQKLPSGTSSRPRMPSAFLWVYQLPTTWYCNGLLFGLPKAQIAKLQRVQNAAARLILGIGKFSHITPALYELHWLPVSLRIDYKILLLTFKCIYGLAPTYLSDLISIKSNSLYNLRSTGKLLLDHPKGKMLTTLGAKSFSAAAPKLWNGLPVELRQATSLNSFKSRLKSDPA